ncbi:MAG: acyl-CoA dehydrogenase family protein [Acidimicrobiales bacterium]
MTEPDVEQFRADADAWLGARLERRPIDRSHDIVWGEGDFSVSVFHALDHDEEAALLDEIRTWVQAKAELGYHAITWPVEHGGLGLSKAHGRAFSRLEAQYVTPSGHETLGVTTGLIAPTIEIFGTDAQKEQFLAPLLRTDVFACQLFSEPGAGSDLGALACRAERDGDEWVVNGQKVWSSGAQFSDWGELIARTDPDVAKHKGMTAFMVPMDAEGVEVRPIGQMSGGSSFSEVFFTDVRIPDRLRLGPVGEGWKVALTTLSFERDHSSSGGGGSRVGGSWRQLLATAQALGVTDDPIIRDALVDVYLHSQVERYTMRRAADLARGGRPGPEGSLGKLMWTEGMRRISDAVSLVLGPRLTADSGEWGTYAWAEHVLGAPGYRIAGGSDEVQRNIIGERVLGLPGEPRVDKGVPFKDIPR